MRAAMSFRIILIAIFCFQMILNMTRPIVTLYGAELGASTLEIGYLTAAYALIPLFLSIYAGRIADKVGDRLPVLSGFIGVGTGMAIPALIDSLWALYLSQIIVGISHVLIVISLQNLLGNAAPPHKRDYYFSMFSTAVSVGAVAGPVAGGYMAEHISYPSVFAASLVLCIIAFILAWRLQASGKTTAPAEATLISSLGLLKIPQLRKAMISSALALYSRDIFVAYFPLYAQGMDISASSIGWILTLQGLMMVVVRFSLTKLTNAFGRDYVLMASIFVAGICFLLLPIWDHILVLAVLSACMGAGLGCSQPLSMTTTYNASPKSRTGEVLGLRLTVNRASQIVAPLFFGLIGSSAGLLSVFILSGVFLVGGTWVVKPSKRPNVDEPL
ncbi:MFS transporter [Paenibacillus sp. PL2-23]|uniref:MFS transporter n=1 Tax=Paenibacillus sp. PL2-23 TaxID=2100729 RepID=UPI0030F51D6C